MFSFKIKAKQKPFFLCDVKRAVATSRFDYFLAEGAVNGAARLTSLMRAKK